MPEKLLRIVFENRAELLREFIKLIFARRQDYRPRWSESIYRLQQFADASNNPHSKMLVLLLRTGVDQTENYQVCASVIYLKHTW